MENSFQKRRKREDRYFAECRSEIAAQNLKMHRQVVHFLMVAYVLLLGAASLVLSYFTVNSIYYYMFPIILGYFLFYVITRKRRMTERGAGLLCLSFYVLFFIEIVMIDDLHDTTVAAAWFQVLIVAAPAMLIMRFRHYILFDTLFAVFHLTTSYIVKQPEIFSKDVFSTIAGVSVALMVSWIVMDIRIEQGLQQDELLQMTKKAEEALSDAERANAAKSEFLSRMSHEIRTPINAILGMDEIILRDYKDTELRGYANNIRHAGNTLLLLVNDILDLSKIEAGRMELFNESYETAAFFNDLYHLIIFQAERKELSVNFHVDKTIPRRLYGDQGRLKQITLNILSNAVKYTESGSITLIVTQEEVSAEEMLLCVTVKDTGIGIKEEDMESLLHPFVRLDETRNHSIEGTGLGLNIVTQLLQMMDAQLEVESTYGEGSAFSYKVKQRVEDHTPMGDFRMEQTGNEPRKGTVKKRLKAPEACILVVDDTEMNLTVAKGLLRPTGIMVDTAASAAEGLSMLSEMLYDVIFVDQRMPKMNGEEMLSEIRKLFNKNAHAPCIVLTADAVIGARERYISAGFDDYLSKPITYDAIERVLIAHLPEEKVHLEDGEELVDTEKGMKWCGDRETYREVLFQFYKTIDEKANEIREYYDAEDWENYTVKVHALKSSARVVGAEKLSEFARELEEAGDTRDLAKIRRETDDLLALYRKHKEQMPKEWKNLK